MMRLKSKSIVILSCLFCLTVADNIVAQPTPENKTESMPPQNRMEAPSPLDLPGRMREGRARRGARRRGRDFQQRREQMRQRLEQARMMAQKLLDNPNTSEDIKAKARRLNELMDKRNRLDHDIDVKRQDFMRTHQQDLDALRRLQEQAEPHRQNLRVAREKIRTENQPLIDEMRRTTQEVREIARDIRREYRSRDKSLPAGQAPPSSFPLERQRKSPERRQVSPPSSQEKAPEGQGKQ